MTLRPPDYSPFAETQTWHGWIEESLSLALSGAVALALILAALNGWTPGSPTPMAAQDFLLLAAVVFIFYFPLSLYLGGLSWLLALLFKTPWLTRLGWGMAGLFWGYAVFLQNPKTLRALFWGDAAPWYEGASRVLFVFCSLSILSLAFRPRRFFKAPRILPVLLGIGFLALSISASLWPSPRVASPVELSKTPPALTGERLLVIGLDGADWRFIEPLMACGEMPELKALKEGGAWGPLRSFKPTKSPMIWTSIVTGVTPAEHGIDDFAHFRYSGFSPRVNDLQKPKNLGVSEIQRVLKKAGHLTLTPIALTARRVPAFWTLASRFGLTMDVVTWWTTWPAEPLRGRMLGDRAYFWHFNSSRAVGEVNRHAYPSQLFEELSEQFVSYQSVTLDDALPFMDIDEAEFLSMKEKPYEGIHLVEEFLHIFAAFESNRRIALELLAHPNKPQDEPSDMLVLFRFIDKASHASMRFSELVDKHPGTGTESLTKYHRFLSEAYRQNDLAVGELVRAFGPGNIIVLSDHGFELQESAWGVRLYDHDFAPDGMFIAQGPAFKPGRIDGLSVYDIMPTLMALKGMPLAEDFKGQLREDLFETEFLKTHPPVYIPSYGAMDDIQDAISDEAVEKEMLEQLRALGYIQ